LAKTRKAFEVVLEDGRVVVLKKLTTGEMLRAMQAAGNHKGESAQAFATSLEQIRLSVTSVNGKPVTYADLLGDQLDDVFETDDIIVLSRAWSKIHLPSDDSGNVRAVATGGSGT
jgi:hypothetical protein